MRVAPYGSWPSPVRAEDAAAVGDRFDGVDLDGTDVYWLEHRPREGGRSVVCRLGADGTRTEVTPPGFDVRSRAYGYGGGAWTVHNGSLYVVNQPDGQVHRLDPGRPPVPLTPAADGHYGDLTVAPGGGYLVCVRDTGRDAEVVAIPTGGGGPVRRLVGGAEFCAAPRVDPAGRRLAWLTWQHPDMPWDRGALWLADLSDGRVSGARAIVDRPGESVLQPAWSPHGVLHAVSDRGGWWNLHRWDGEDLRPLAPLAEEFAVPPWTLGTRCYDFLPGGRIACVHGTGAYRRLGVIEPGTSGVRPVPVAATWIAPRIRVRGDRVVCVAADPATAPALAEYTVDGAGPAPQPAGQLSTPRPVRFTTRDGSTGHALYYPPTNPDVTGPGAPPPLVVNCHGGPTAGVSSQYNAELQFFATRGLAVLDVDYAGSAGYGRAYRQRLAGAWGVLDVADCVDAARAMVADGLADGDRMVVRGASAGGYTALCAATFEDVFAAAVSYYGIGDLDALAAGTHRFESRYAEGLLGQPAGHPVYRQRSPLYHLDRIRCPVLLLHGSDDPIVPPAQARAIAGRLAAAGVPHVHVEFPGEDHGFRRVETVRTALLTELDFYGQVLGFSPAP